MTDSKTIKKHETEVARLREALAAARAEAEQRRSDLEAAESATGEIPRLTAAARLGEIEPEQAAEQKAAIAAALDDARKALEETEDEVAEIELRVEEAGDAWAAASMFQPQQAGYVAQQRRLALEAQLAEARRIEEAALTVYRDAQREAERIVDETRETATARFYLEERRNRERARGADALRRALQGEKHLQERIRAGEFGAEVLTSFEGQLAAYRERQAAAAEVRVNPDPRAALPSS